MSEIQESIGKLLNGLNEGDGEAEHCLLLLLDYSEDAATLLVELAQAALSSSKPPTFAQRCPDREERFERFCSGDLDLPDETPLALHIASCDKCMNAFQEARNKNSLAEES